MIKSVGEFIRALDAAQPRLAKIGHESVQLFSSESLTTEQLGYAYDPEGHDLTGTDEGDWRNNWMVFATEGMCGDPIFVDISSAAFPVYTAMHGRGAWDPTLIAGSFSGFMEALSLLARLSVGRDNPEALRANPLSSQDLSELREALACLGPEADVEFWASWFNVGAGERGDAADEARASDENRGIHS